MEKVPNCVRGKSSEAAFPLVKGLQVVIRWFFRHTEKQVYHNGVIVTLFCICTKPNMTHRRHVTSAFHVKTLRYVCTEKTLNTFYT